jgi:hypothetical protein
LFSFAYHGKPGDPFTVAAYVNVCTVAGAIADISCFPGCLIGWKNPADFEFALGRDEG